MTSIKYDVTIPVDWEHDGVKAILNKYNIHLDNDHKGTWISFTTFITKAIDELTKICNDLFIHAYKADKSFYKLRWRSNRQGIESKAKAAYKAA